MVTPIKAPPLYLVTGSTDGIGKHTAAKIWKKGFSIIIHGRSPQRVEETVRTIKADGGVEGQRIIGLTADLSDFAAVRRLADQVAENGPLYCLTNNAGTFQVEKETSVDGFEMTYAVNVLAPFMLTGLLMQKGCLDPRGRIVNVASISSATGKIDFGNLNQERGFDPHTAYSNSKLHNIVFTRELAARLKERGSRLNVRCLDPGTINTKMLYAGWGDWGAPLSVANDLYVCCTRDALDDGPVGTYYVARTARLPPPETRDRSIGQRLWAEWERQTGIVYPGPMPAPARVASASTAP